MRIVNFWLLFTASNVEIAGVAALVGIVSFLLGLRMWRRMARQEATRRRGWPVFLLVLGFLLLTIVIVSVSMEPRYVLHLFESDVANADRLNELRNRSLTSREERDFPPGEWPQWRGPGRDGITRESIARTNWIANPPTILWKQPIGKGHSSISVAHGRLYTMDRQENRERVICLDAASGKEIWSHAYEADFQQIRVGEKLVPGPRSTPTVHDGRVYALGALGRFVCLEATAETAAAKVLWEHDLMAEYDLLGGLKPRLPEWGIACSPLVEGDLVIVQPGGEQGSIAAFDRKTGALRWQALSDVNGYCSPMAATVAGVRQIIAMTGDRAVGLAPADGRLLWTYNFATGFHGNIATPIIAGDYVFISADYGMGCALLKLIPDGKDGVTADPVYFKNNKLMRNHHATCVMCDNYLYGFDSNFLKCIDMRTGEDKWHAGRAVEKGCLIAAKSHLLILTQLGKLVLVEATPAEFRKLVEMQVLEADSGTTWALPVLVEGRLYLRDGSQIMCLDLRSP